MKADSFAFKVYDHLRRKILSNQIPVNTRLKEDEWAKRIEVSRMAVREALTRLLGEGLVLLGEKGGYYIKPMTPEDVHELRELREVLELGALKLAIKKISKQQFESLDKICDDFSGMAANQYFNGALEADMKFHETLVELSGNKNLLQTYLSSHIPLFHQKLGASKKSADDYEQTDAEHRELVKALKKKDMAKAEDILIKHFARGEAFVLDLL
ncbi:MAG: GntR family transcriptional regulator [Flavitalea sp.]